MFAEPGDTWLAQRCQLPAPAVAIEASPVPCRRLYAAIALAKQMTHAPKPAPASVVAADSAGIGIPAIACQNKPAQSASHARPAACVSRSCLGAGHCVQARSRATAGTAWIP